MKNTSTFYRHRPFRTWAGSDAQAGEIIADFAKIALDVAVALILCTAVILPQVQTAQTDDADNATLYGSIVVFFIIAILYFVVSSVRGRYTK